MNRKYQVSIENAETSEDDIDELFSQLEQFQPPKDFVQRVMQAVSKLPLPQVVTENTESIAGEGLIVHRENVPPS